MNRGYNEVLQRDLRSDGIQTGSYLPTFREDLPFPTCKRQVLPKRRCLTTDIRCVTTIGAKIYSAAED